MTTKRNDVATQLLQDLLDNRRGQRDLLIRRANGKRNNGYTTVTFYPKGTESAESDGDVSMDTIQLASESCLSTEHTEDDFIALLDVCGAISDHLSAASTEDGYDVSKALKALGMRPVSGGGFVLPRTKTEAFVALLDDSGIKVRQGSKTVAFRFNSPVDSASAVLCLQSIRVRFGITLPLKANGKEMTGTEYRKSNNRSAKTQASIAAQKKELRDALKASDRVAFTGHISKALHDLIMAGVAADDGDDDSADDRGRSLDCLAIRAGLIDGDAVETETETETAEADAA